MNLTVIRRNFIFYPTGSMQKNGAQHCAPLFFIIVGGVRQNFRTHKTKWTKELYSAEGGVPQNFKTHKTRAAKIRFRKKIIKNLG